MDVSLRQSILIVLRAVAVGMVLAIAGHIPKNLIFVANLRIWPTVPWLIVPTLLYMWAYWRYLDGAWWPRSIAEFRHRSMRARSLPPRIWFWALLAGFLGIVALVFTLRVVNRMVQLPEQVFFDVSQTSTATVIAIIVVGAIVAGIVEESAFRGYMQGPIEERFGIVTATLITGLMFAVAHLGLTAVLIPYYVAVAALYGVIAYLTKSILPTVVLHTAGNIFSSSYLWLTGHAEWQRSRGAERLVWDTGSDPAFERSILVALVSIAAMILGYVLLARAARRGVATPA